MASETQTSDQPKQSQPRLQTGDRRYSGKRRALWVGFLAVLVPLLVLLAMQYWWLVDLERKSTIARQAALENYLDAVAKEVHYFYTSTAERSLNISWWAFTPEKLGKMAHFFKKKKVEGARQLFVISYLTRDFVHYYDPETFTVRKADFSPQIVAIWAATAPWKILVKKGGLIDTTGLRTDERDPEHRIILNPITDESSKLVGLAGMIIDQDYFTEVVLPKAIANALPAFSGKHDLKVVVHDQDGRLVYPSDVKVPGREPKIRRHLSYVFTDWKIGLYGGFATPEQWARGNFAFNMSLSVVLAMVLISGIVLALRTASREMRLSRMKNDFVSNVSHELRTPLSSIRVFGEFMRRGRVTQQNKIREYGEYIENESRRLTQLINNILDFSRIESGRKVYTFEQSDLEDVVQGALSTCAVRLRSSGFKIDYRPPAAPLPTLRIDSGAIDRAVCNLLDNAAKYSGDGREIVVCLTRTDSQAQLSVQDNGSGISREEQKRIFERFHRVSTGLVHDVKGSGLGLSIVQHIARAHGGKIAVDSEPGQGSTFTISLPCESTTIPEQDPGGTPA